MSEGTASVLLGNEATPVTEAPSTTQSTTTTPPASADGAANTNTADGAVTGDAAKESAPGDKPGEGAETGKDNSEGSQTDSEGAPETYQFVAPEGFELNAEAAAAFDPIARKHNLTNAAAQEFVDLFASEVTRIQTAQVEFFHAEAQRWVDAVKVDPEIGGKTDDEVSAKLGVAKRALNKFGSQALGEVLTASKLGNHPEIIRAFYRVGLTLSEDKQIERGAPAGNANARLADQLWPTSTPNQQGS